MFRRTGVLLFGVLAVTAVIAGSSANARTQAVAPTRVLDLGTKAGVLQYLKVNHIRIGAGPVVIQRGQKNYAGPTCPGITWTCTTATRVVQFGPNNQFQCSASNQPGGSATAPDDCTIVQQSTTANNVATCVENDSSPTASQSCVIFQSSTTGANTATVLQRVNAGTGSTQNVNQYSGIDQESGDGANSATVTQTITGSVTSPGSNTSGSESQDGHQGSSVTQFASGAGNNSATVNQSLALSAMTQGVKTISQLQNTNGSSPNLNSGIDQTSGTGTNAATLNQASNLTAFAAGATAGVQTQGAPTLGLGLNGVFNQSSPGVSTINGSQVEQQTETANPVPGSSVAQTQYGPTYFDPDQFSNGSNTYNLNQSSTQQQNKPGGFQDDQEYAQCFTSGNCTATQQINQNGQSSSNSCGPTSSCDIGVTQTTTSEGTTSSTCGGSVDAGIESDVSGCDVGFPPPPPPPCVPSFCDDAVASPGRPG